MSACGVQINMMRVGIFLLLNRRRVAVGVERESESRAMLDVGVLNQ